MTDALNVKINEWYSSSDYNSDIDSCRTKIMQEASQAASEADTAYAFEQELYYLIRKKIGIILNVRKEVKVSGINHIFGLCNNRTSINGRLDAVINNLIIEYKHHSKLRSHNDILSAVKQVEDYLYACYNSSEIKYNAILTDGISISFFTFCGDDVVHTDLAGITQSDFDKVVKAILANSTKKFVSKNILMDFSISDMVDSVAKNAALSFYNALINHITDKTLMLFTEWRALMHLSLNDNGKGNDINKRRRDLSLIFSDTINSAEREYYALYALQTTYAVIVKLIACKVVDKLDNVHIYSNLSKISSVELQHFIEMIEDGYSYQSNNVTNFLEGDFFSWYCDALQWNNDIYISIIRVIKCIDQYSTFSMDVYYEPIDIFKDLYMSIIPQSIRHSMGEYFTPEWLADYVVQRSTAMLDTDKWKAIDPCCGSGIFMMALIKRIVGKVNIHQLSEAEKEELKTQILSRVYGIDINPLSVLSARVGYFLALKPFGDLNNLEIPVYLGDSAILASRKEIGGIDCYTYSINNVRHSFDVVLPIRFVKSNKFSKIMNDLQACVKTGDGDVLFQVLYRYFTEKERSSEELVNEVRKFSNSLAELYNNKWDGIWIRIATNFMLIARLSDFDLIIGNPPWVKWEHLPAVYADRIKKVCNIKHIFSGAGQFGGTQLNICALISNVTATNWLGKNGVLAFLMPDSIMSQNSYEGFRNFYLDYNKGERLYLQEIDKWVAPLRPFRCNNKAITQDFNTYYYSRKKTDYSLGIPVKVISRKKTTADILINEKKSFDAVQSSLIFSNSVAKQLSNDSTAFSYLSEQYDFSRIIGETSYKYRTGVEFTPQELYMLVGNGKSKHKGHYLFFNRKFALSKYEVNDSPKEGWDFPVDLIYPIITGPHIEAFHFNSSNEFCILPYLEGDTKKPIIKEKMIKYHRKIFTYLANHKTIIDMQSEKSKIMHRGEEFYSLSKIGDYTFADNIVAARDNSTFCACVVNKQVTPWQEIKQTICVKHTIIISQDKYGRFITEDEAYYICGILNSEIVQQYIHSTFKSNGYSLNKSKLYIPLYDGNNQLHREISDIARKATQNAFQGKNDMNLKSVQNVLMNLYLLVCDSKSN